MSRMKFIKMMLMAAITAISLPACMSGLAYVEVVAKSNSTILAVLRQECEVETIERKLNGVQKNYAISVNGTTERAGFYWLFYVDGEIADKPIDEKMVQKGQSITAHLLSTDEA